jgi:Dyp-type peroxidase family
MPESSNTLPVWSEMQGLILSAYPHLFHANYLLCSFADRSGPAARGWLRRLLPHMTFAMRKSRLERYEQDHNINVALTYRGLTTLCPSSGHELAGFSFPFTEGIDGQDHRRRMLGDTDSSDPSTWHWGGRHQPVDLLLAVFARDAVALDKAIAECGPPPGVMERISSIQALPLDQATRREHFGFVDGISQPILEGTHDAERFPESRHLTKLGEIVLGYRNADGGFAEMPMLGGCRFGENGSYLVLRQLEQDVPGFWEYVSQQTMRHGGPEAAEQLAAKIVGREPNGTPLVPYVNRQDNEFGFAEDPHGYGCPIGAHIRRANPRDSFNDNNVPSHRASLSNRHRILRRGRSYGPVFDHETRFDARTKDTEKRGLMFICLNADLERQFEFIQQNWINSPAFFGLADERDPLVGNQDADSTGRCRFTVPGLPAPTRVDGIPRFVTVKGGEYFFLPGRRALLNLVGDAG